MMLRARPFSCLLAVRPPLLPVTLLLQYLSGTSILDFPAGGTIISAVLNNQGVGVRVPSARSYMCRLIVVWQTGRLRGSDRMERVPIVGLHEVGRHPCALHHVPHSYDAAAARDTCWRGRQAAASTHCSLR